jgi:hypothetical protein
MYLSHTHVAYGESRVYMLLSYLDVETSCFQQAELNRILSNLAPDV